MNNIVRHARARHAHISLHIDTALTTLTVEDDGQGFNTHDVLQASDKERRLGLFGIEERVSLLGGTFKVDSQPGRGTCVQIKVPLGRIPSELVGT